MKHSFLFVCIANFCRSPVAEKIFKSIFLDDAIIKSAGLINYNKKYMHPASQKFLKSIEINDVNHKTQKISEELVKDSNIIFCMDNKILNEVQNRFPNHAAKARLISQKNIIDTVNYEDQENIKVMLDMISQLEEENTKLKAIN